MNKRVEIIAEVGQAHDGSLGILHSYIDAIAKAGADVAKFQLHIANSESSTFEPFRVNFSYADKTRYDYWKRIEFSFDEWVEIKTHCEDVGLEFMASPFSVAAVRMLEALGVKRYKIASGEIDNYLMLKHIAATGKDLFISTGMSDIAEIQSTLKFLDSCDARGRRAIMQCTSSYPVLPEDVGLNLISVYREKFGLSVGFSDHSGSIYNSLAAVVLGVNCVECHVVFDKAMFGPDTSSSLNFEELSSLVCGIRLLERTLLHPVKKELSTDHKSLKAIFGKSLSVSCDLLPGETVKIDDLETKKPAGKGIPAREFQDVLGKKVVNCLSTGDFINWDDLE